MSAFEKSVPVSTMATVTFLPVASYLSEAASEPIIDEPESLPGPSVSTESNVSGISEA